MVWPNKRGFPVKEVAINDADYNISISARIDGKKKTLWVCPIYQKWMSVLERSLGKAHKAVHTSYESVGVCEEWLRFSNFKAWMESQVWEGLNLDKDLLIPGNKTYSPEACCFIDTSLNMLLHRSVALGEYPMGVTKTPNRKTYNATCAGRSGHNTATIIRVNTVEEAHAIWQVTKIRIIQERINKYRDKPEYRKDVEDALYLRIDQLQDDYDNGRITTKLL